MKNNRQADFVVMGAGALGMATALALLNEGAQVTLLERGAVGKEASWAGGGILSPLCPWDYSQEVTQLAARGAALFEPWAAELQQKTGIDPEYSRCGMRVLAPFDLQKAQSWCIKNSVPFSLIEDNIQYNQQVIELSGLHLPNVAQVRNPRLLRAMRARVEQLGGKIIEQCEVLEFEFESHAVRALKTTQGEIKAGHYVLTAGAWSAQLLGKQALSLDIKPIRGQMLLFKFERPPLDFIVLKKDLYLIPRRDGHLLVGSTLEDVGFDKSTTEAARELLWQGAIKILPELSQKSVLQQWAGLRPGSPHNIPHIARHAEFENLYLNTGHFRYGVTMALASAERLLSEITLS
jgi:glycine oxidase